MDLLTVASGSKKKYAWEIVKADGTVENTDVSYLGCLQHCDARVTKEMVAKGPLFTRKRGYNAMTDALKAEGEGRTLRVTHNGEPISY